MFASFVHSFSERGLSAIQKVDRSGAAQRSRYFNSSDWTVGSSMAPVIIRP